MSTLHKDLAEVMNIVGYIQKDGKNDFHKYKYASAEKVLGKVNEELSKRGICIQSQAQSVHYEHGHAVVWVRLNLRRGDETISFEGIGEGSDKGDKAIMKANTAAIKYALASGFLISWGDDPEQDSSTDERGDLVDGWVKRIHSAKDATSLVSLTSELQKLTTNKSINAAEAKKLRRVYTERLEYLNHLSKKREVSL